MSERNVRICHVNAQSIKKMERMIQFRYYFETNYYDIICVSETWLDEEIPDCSVRLKGYQMFRNDSCGLVKTKKK